MIARGAGPLVCAGAVFVALVGAAEGESRAARLMVRLEYGAGPGCPDATDFKSLVIPRLGYDPFIESAPHHVLVSIESRGAATNGRIEWRDSAGRWTGDQTFPSVSADCASLVRAMGFALAVQIQFLATADAARDSGAAPPPKAVPPPDGAPTDRPAAPPAAATTISNEAAPSPTAGPRPVFAIGAGPSVGLGMSSTPVLLGRLFGGLAWRRFSVELAAAMSVPSTTRRTDGAGFSQQHLLASVATCAIVTRWNACLLANVGEVRMTGDIALPTSAVVPIVQAGARVGVSQRLGRRAFLNARADGLVHLARWSASLDQVPVWTAPRFAAAFGVDVGVRFP